MEVDKILDNVKRSDHVRAIVANQNTIDNIAAQLSSPPLTIHLGGSEGTARGAHPQQEDGKVAQEEMCGDALMRLNEDEAETPREHESPREQAEDTTSSAKSIETSQASNEDIQTSTPDLSHTAGEKAGEEERVAKCRETQSTPDFNIEECTSDSPHTDAESESAADTPKRESGHSGGHNRSGVSGARQLSVELHVII